MCKCHQHQNIYRTVPSTLLPIFFAEYYSIAYKYIPQFVDGHWLLSWYEHLFTGLCIDIDLFFLCPFSVSNELGWVQFSCSVVSDSLRPMDYSMPGLPVHHQCSRVYSNSCLLSQWCHPTISSLVIPFSCLQSLPASRPCPMSQFFASGGQSIGTSASPSVLPMNSQDWFPLGWTG